MRKISEAVGLGALAILFWTTFRALYGPDRLPERIPVHFDRAGNPNGWGSPSVLLLLPAVALGIYLLICVVSLFPSAFNFPARVTPENRARLEALAQRLMAWIKVEVTCFFAWIQWSILEAVRNGHAHLSALGAPAFLAALAMTTVGYLVAMGRAARSR